MNSKYKKEFIDMMIEDIVLQQIETILEDKLILFFDEVSLDDIFLDYNLIKFKELYLEYYNISLVNSCRDGIIESYNTLYFTTQKIIKNRWKKI